LDKPRVRQLIIQANSQSAKRLTHTHTVYTHTHIQSHPFQMAIGNDNCVDRRPIKSFSQLVHSPMQNANVCVTQISCLSAYIYVCASVCVCELASVPIHSYSLVAYCFECDVRVAKGSKQKAKGLYT